MGVEGGNTDQSTDAQRTIIDTRMSGKSLMREASYGRDRRHREIGRMKPEIIAQFGNLTFSQGTPDNPEQEAYRGMVDGHEIYVGVWREGDSPKASIDNEGLSLEDAAKLLMTARAAASMIEQDSKFSARINEENKASEGHRVLQELLGGE